MDGRAADVRTPLMAFRELLGSERVLYAAGLRNSRDLGRDGFAAAVATARGVILLFLGEEQILSGEARSRAFLNRPSSVFSREQIMAAAYQLNIQVSDRTIDSHIRNIRAKLAAVNCDNVIETIHGVGLKLGRCEPQA
jgi:hypothetical protein